jgi:hypothetical protein
MAFAPTSIGQLSADKLSGLTTLPGMPLLAGQATDRLGSGADLQALAAPSALTAQFEQSLQTQQLTQLLGLLAMLMQNKPTNASNGATGQNGSDGVAPVNGASSGSQAAGSGATAAGGSGSAPPSNTGSTVERQGKPIGGHIAKQFDSMVAAAKQDGVNITITSGKRSRAEQERLYAAYKNGTGNLAAKPGTSNHESGDALDLGPPSAYGWLKQNAGRFGFKNTIPSEPWHWSLSGN